MDLFGFRRSKPLPADIDDKANQCLSLIRFVDLSSISQTWKAAWEATWEAKVKVNW